MPKIPSRSTISPKRDIGLINKSETNPVLMNWTKGAVALFGGSIAAALLAASAAALAAGEEPGRYTMTPVEGGFARLDRETGAMSICTGKEGDWTCKPIAEMQKEMQDRIQKLESENKTLKAEKVARAAVVEPRGRADARRCRAPRRYGSTRAAGRHRHADREGRRQAVRLRRGHGQEVQGTYRPPREGGEEEGRDAALGHDCLRTQSLRSSRLLSGAA